MRIVPLYAAVLALIFIALSVRTLRMRRRLRIAVGDGGDAGMLRAMRVHANFAEYVPLSVLLIGFVEATGASAGFVHALGTSVVAGRVLHAFGVSQVRETYAFRVLGMALTLTAIGVAAIRLLLHAVG
jgi:uncharacterized membrane protein YecN with MAPEG domain